MKIARVFPRKTTASPDDSLAFFGPPVGDLDVDEVHVSCLFSYDKEKAEQLAKEWESIAPVKIGGVAYGDRGNNFTPGMYIKKGYTITSRGCPNKCWFCDVWKREGTIRELPIKPGWNVLDSNLLACSDYHIRAVFRMLSEQTCKAEFTGGIEAKLLDPWHVDLFWELRPNQIFFAYDTPDDLEPLIRAGRLMREANFTRRHLRCYVLCGFNGDTFVAAQVRMWMAWKAGFMPMAMLYRDKKGTVSDDWKAFQREYARPAITKQKMRQYFQKSYVLRSE